MSENHSSSKQKRTVVKVAAGLTILLLVGLPLANEDDCISWGANAYSFLSASMIAAQVAMIWEFRQK